MDAEIWKKVDGYPNYEVSNLGNVRSLNYHREGESKILKTSLNNKGYLYITLCKEGKTKRYFVHRLVAQAFLDNPNNLPQVNHKDEDKTNNHVSNIEYCDAKYNMNYGTRIDRQKQNTINKQGKECNYSKPINQYSKDNVFIKRWDCASDVKRELGFSNSNICLCLRGKRKSCGGYIWKYAS